MSGLVQDLPSPPPSPSHDYLDDVFASANSHIDSTENSVHPSSITKVQRVHQNDGYRDGISTSKGVHVQDGFDEGYPLGAELALQAGVLLGALQQLCQDLESCLKSTRKVQVEPVDPFEADGEGTGRRDQHLVISIQSMYVKAQEELSVQNIFSREHFDEDGIWTWDTSGSTADGTDASKAAGPGPGPGQEDHGLPHSEGAADSSLRAVAHSHPLLVRWQGHLRTIFRQFGLDDSGLSWQDIDAEDG